MCTMITVFAILFGIPFIFSAGFAAGAIWNGMFRRSANHAHHQG